MERVYNLDWEIPKLACRRIDPEFAQEGARRIRIIQKNVLEQAFLDRNHIHFNYESSEIFKVLSSEN